MSNFVSIAIPIYNAEPYLKYAIQSVINQTYTDWTLYLINDGSTDGSIDIMKEFASKDERIIIVDDGLNKGLIERLNQSILLVDSKYYARMDADDIMYVTRIEEQVSFLESHPDIDVLGCSIMTIDNNNLIVGSGSSYGKVSGFVHPTVMGKTQWFKNNQYRKWALRAEDAELWCRTSSTSHFWSLEKPLLFYREFGVPTLKKTLQSLFTLLKIYSNYSEYGQTIKWFLKNSIQVIMKMFVYVLFAIIGKMEYCIRLRKRKPISKDKLLTDNDLIASIKPKNVVL